MWEQTISIGRLVKIVQLSRKIKTSCQNSRYRGVRHPRHRFRPVHPADALLQRSVQREQPQWREWKARHRDRQSEAGKQKRRQKTGDTGWARNEPEQRTRSLVNRARVIARETLAAPAIGLGLAADRWLPVRFRTFPRRQWTPLNTLVRQHYFLLLCNHGVRVALDWQKSCCPRVWLRYR